MAAWKPISFFGLSWSRFGKLESWLAHTERLCQQVGRVALADRLQPRAEVLFTLSHGIVFMCSRRVGSRFASFLAASSDRHLATGEQHAPDLTYIQGALRAGHKCSVIFAKRLEWLHGRHFT